MNIPRGIEGDYLETKRNNLFFDIKGLHHPKNRKICFIRFFPDPEGDRIKQGIKYTKVYNLEERFSLIKEKYPGYLYYSKNLDLEVQSVKNKDIKKIYTPLEHFKDIFRKKVLTNIENLSKITCDLFIQEANVPNDAIGISGSSMIGLDNLNSDIDIIIYGTSISHKFQEDLNTILNTSKTIRRYNQEELINHYNWRFGGSKIKYEDFLRTESRKLHQGIINNTEYFIRYIKSPEDWKGCYEDYLYQDLGKVEFKASIKDSKDSIFTPCSYKVESVKILKKDKKAINVSANDIHEINSYRGRFCEQATNGEKVFVAGKLEKVIFEEEEIYYRILLTDQKEDMMILTS